MSRAWVTPASFRYRGTFALWRTCPTIKFGSYPHCTERLRTVKAARCLEPQAPPARADGTAEAANDSGRGSRRAAP
jgi:hypothetical protein